MQEEQGAREEPGEGTRSRTRSGKSVRGVGGKGITMSRNWEQDKIGREFKRRRRQGKHQEQDLGEGRDREGVQEEQGQRKHQEQELGAEQDRKRV